MNLIILSDTHNLLRPAVLDLLPGADLIFHAGDISSQAVVERLASFAPLCVVRGNNDRGEWAESIPHHLSLTLGGVRFYMVHNQKDVPDNLEDTDVVLFGHSHKYCEEQRGNQLWLNPGSCGPRRFQQEITLMRARVSGGVIQVEKLLIPHEVP